MPSGAFTAARHLEYEDTWLNGGQGALDFKQLRGSQDFRPQCVYANESSDDDQTAAGYAVIDCTLFGENDTFRATYRIDIGRPVGLAVRKVWAEGTTARGLKLLTEQ